MEHQGLGSGKVFSARTGYDPWEVLPVRGGWPCTGSLLHEADYEQQQAGAYRGIDDVTNDASTNVEAKPRKHGTRDGGADDPDDDVADEAEAGTLHDEAGEPAGDGTNEQPCDNSDGRHERVPFYEVRTCEFEIEPSDGGVRGCGEHCMRA